MGGDINEGADKGTEGHEIILCVSCITMILNIACIVIVTISFIFSITLLFSILRYVFLSYNIQCSSIIIILKNN